MRVTSGIPRGQPRPTRTQLVEQRLVALGDRRRRRPAPRRTRGRPRPIARAPLGVVEQRGQGLGERLGVVGRHGQPGAGLARPPGPPRCRRRRWPPPVGRRPGSSRVFDGTLDRARPRRSGTTWMSAGGQHLGQPLLGLEVDEHARCRGPRPARSSSARAEPPPLIDEHHVGRRSRRARAAASSTRSSDCEKPTLPAYITTRLPVEAVLGAVGVLAGRGADAVGVDEVGDDPDAVVGVGHRAPDLGRRRCRAGRRTAR